MTTKRKRPAAKKPTTKKKKTTPRDPKPRPLQFTDDVRDAGGELYRYTAKEKKFIFEYLTDPRHVGSAAAKSAGYDAKSDAVYRVIASQLLRKENIRAALNLAFESLTMPKMETLFRLGRIAAGDLDDLLDDNGDFNIDLARERGTTFLLKKIEIDRDVIEVKEGGEDLERSIIKEKVKVTIHDPLKALELLGKHGKLFVERIEATGRDGSPLLPDGGAKVVFYIPDNGRGDGDQDSKAKRTEKHSTRRPATTPDPASRTRGNEHGKD